MVDSDSRRFTRVNFRQPVQLDFGDGKYHQAVSKNISLAGLYIIGDFQQKLGDICIIELSQGGPDALVELRAKCSVVRIKDDGIALEFLSMNQESMLFLQTTLLYRAEDPILFGSEFIKNISFKLEEDG